MPRQQGLDSGAEDLHDGGSEQPPEACRELEGLKLIVGTGTFFLWDTGYVCRGT